MTEACDEIIEKIILAQQLVSDAAWELLEDIEYEQTNTEHRCSCQDPDGCPPCWHCVECGYCNAKFRLTEAGVILE